MNSTYPTDLKIVEENNLLIQWSDGERRRYSFRELRDGCPCATCREKRGGGSQTPSLLPVLSAAEAQPLRIEGMQPVGTYAYTIAFSDGHDTGIFSFELLRRLGEIEGVES
ncbi:MAG: DUF971 domain-containing protein [Pirellulales bacterium]|nr:DUF971 domain-containing protein [Pirellulales bacterium]